MMYLIQPHDTRLKLAANTLTRFQVFAPYANTQPVDGVIGAGDNISFV